MRCCAQILSLLVKVGLKESKDPIVSIFAVKYVWSSTARLQRFKACVEKMKIESKSLVCLDVETRWNSTYLMLKTAIKFQAFNENNAANSQPFGEEIVLDVNDDPTTYLSYGYKRLLEETSSGTGVKFELERYLGEQCEFLDNKFDILDWCKKNESRLPVMAVMAKDILMIPALTVAFESSFSTGGRVLDTFRNSLTPTLVEVLACSQNWLRSKNVPLVIKEKLEELESLKAGFAPSFLIYYGG
ncbi:hypothetical protein OSB04_021290 [Centaurea solstitialis]|uniref:HAT C-terminal dimerisation domain-containing protein n=1 Tax=Centaurea solstitialis TaxID=347529 RepID=A0AA38W6M7_9ASTR|nr:hypothetical protein OSB04_021290 [Centaurea solstitialis]